MMKICALGDSVLKGVVPENGRYRVLDGRFSDLCAAELGISVENDGRFGSTVSGGERMLDRIISRGGLGDFDYTLLEFGGNDCDYNWKAIAAAPDDAHFPNTPLPEFREIYAGLIDKVHAEGSKPVMLSLVPIVSERYFETFSAGMSESGKDNILRWLAGNIEFIHDWHERYNLEVFALAREHGVPIVDITSPFLADRRREALMSCDGIHPSREGHRLIADEIKRHILRRFDSVERWLGTAV